MQEVVETHHPGWLYPLLFVLLIVLLACTSALSGIYVARHRPIELDLAVQADSSRTPELMDVQTIPRPSPFGNRAQ